MTMLRGHHSFAICRGVTDEQLLGWFPYVFPFFFVGMWLLVTTLLGLLSGWFNLQQWYPDDGSEKPLLQLHGQSGQMGAGVQMAGILRLRAYSSGLGIRVSRLFGPFQKPLRIPWSEIEAEPSSSLFLPMVKLHLGRPENGRLKISARSWGRLTDAVPKSDDGKRFQMPAAAPVSGTSFARGLFLRWLLITGIMASFFFFASRSTGDEAALPLGMCIGFPAVVVGVGQLVRYAREG
jgi:hypothetical protein